MDLNSLLQLVKDAIGMHTQQQGTGFNPSGLISDVEGLFGQHAAATGQQILGSSRDPYGDPADQMIRPSSQDPYGDPADQR